MKESSNSDQQNQAEANQSPPSRSQFSHARDGVNESLWQSGVTQNMQDQIAFDPEKVFDTLIIGAGITGLSAALLLQKDGYACVLADAHTPGFGTTGGTSAHINTFADTTFEEVRDGFGEKGAELFADAIREGTDLIRQNIAAYNIDCDYSLKQGYVYAEDEKQAKELDSLFQSALQVGVSAHEVSEVPVNVPYIKAVAFDEQAQFHPLKYLQALLDEFLKLGGILLTDTRIEDIEHDKDFHRARSGSRFIKARKVVYATHIPPGGINLLHLRCAPYRSYVLALTLQDENYPDALIYDMQEPYHYFRTHETDGKKYLLLGGSDHKTGHADPVKAFTDLEAYARKYYKVASVDYKWSSQYYVPADGLPYIGSLPGAAEGIFTATGYNGNGMTLGSAAAKILSDLVKGIENKYHHLFSPSRIKPLAGFTEFIKENADVAYHFIADRFSVREIDSIQSLPPGSGEVLEYKGEKIAVYKDEHGKIYALNPVCTHAKCVVNWNPEEKSWDCPCHGGRFDIHGIVLTGPPRSNLQKINTDE